MSPNKDETGLSLSKACGLMIKWYDQPFVKLELVSRLTKVNILPMFLLWL